MRRALGCLALLALAGCDGSPVRLPRKAEAPVQLPKAGRPVANVDATGYSDERSRDRLQEAATVMDMAGIEPGMSVADIGAGDGYYTVRLAERVGKTGRVLAEDIQQKAIDALGQRVARQRLDNVSIKHGEADDPRLPATSFDRIFMIHMYHEVAEPYAFLWHLRPALREGGEVVVVDSDRAPADHGMPPKLLECEFAAVGYKLVRFERSTALGGYYASFAAVGPRPAPGAITACAG